MQAAALLAGLSLLPGFAFDLTTVNIKGGNLDFTRESMSNSPEILKPLAEIAARVG